MRTTSLVEAGFGNSLWSAHPGKRAVEKLWLAYTPVWGLVCGVIMLGGFAERWTDGPLLLLGIVVALPALLGPLCVRAPEERGRPIHRTSGFKLSLSVCAYSVLLNYTQTPFFFDVLHAHFGFHTTLNIRNNPVFLYLLTIAYFSTYAVLLMVAHRGMQRVLENAPQVLKLVGAASACVVVAGLETLLNATPLMRHLYCFDDMPLALGFGSLAYGIAFMFVLPVWMFIDERPGEDKPWTHVLAFVLAAVYADALAEDVLRYHVAPHFTHVEEGAVGLGRTPDNCLSRP